MDKATSVLAAVNAGKIPDHDQVNHLIDWFLQSILPQIEPNSGAGGLSAQGKALAGGVRELLESYKQIGSNKNDDNLLQEAIWHLSQGDYDATSVDLSAPVGKDEAKTDINDVRAALRTLLQVAWNTLAAEGSSLTHDFASFARLALADAAEMVQNQAGRAADGLRSVESGVQKGERDDLGRVKKSEEEKEHDKDPKVQWEKGMDAVKAGGTAVIGAGQTATAAVDDATEQTTSRLQDAYYKICDRAQKDQEYKKAISTLFSTAEKWITRALDTAEDASKQPTLDSLIDDPTPEQHVPKALNALRTLVERLAGGKSLGDLFSLAGACVVDVRRDPDLTKWARAFFAHVRRSLSEPGYARSDDAQAKFKELGRGWRELLKEDSEKGRRWKEDVGKFRRELTAYEEALEEDNDLQRVRRAHAALGEQVEQSVKTTGTFGLQMILDQASWFWQDIIKVYAPRVFGLLKDMPIPRTEYVASDVEFVLENLDISSFAILPSHTFIRNITDIDINAPAEANATTATAISTLTHVRMQAVQFTLRDVSFFYKDKTAVVGPSEFTGLLEFRLPARGIDVDLKLRLIPNTPEGIKERERTGGFHALEHVAVTIAEDIDVDITQCNHAVMLAVFKPVFVIRFRDALENALTEQLRASVQWLDGIAFDVSRRAEVFADAGLGTGPAFAGAVWSEIGRLGKMDGGALSGWTATGTGFVKRDVGEDKATLAMGAEPQILSGEKRGPKGTFSGTLEDKMDVVADKVGVQVDHDGLREAAGSAKELAGDLVQSGYDQANTFKHIVDKKTSEEQRKEGWKSGAFDF